MYPLFIYYQDTNQITLSGESDTVIMGCRYAPGTGKISQAQPGEVIEEVIDVSLEGTWENIRAKIFSIEKYLEMANQETIPRDWVYLRFYDHDATFDWRSRIVGGRVEFLNHGLVDRDGESQLVKVYVTRLNYWAGSKRSLPCFAAGDASPLIGQYVENIFGHSDAGHKNYFGIDGHLAENDLPTPIEIDFMNALTGDLFYNLTISETSRSHLCLLAGKKHWRDTGNAV